MADVTRREFMADSAKVGAGVAVGLGVLGVSKSAWAGANDRVRVAVIGINGRGKDHIGGLINKENVEIAALCDTDERLFESRVKSITDKGKKAPKTVTDMRRIMDDPEIDVVTIATPNHWHSLAAIWACEAGRTCTSRSRARTTSMKAGSWSTRRRNTAASSNTGRKSGAAWAFGRRSISCAKG